MKQFVINRGSDSDFTLRCKNPNGTPFPLTGIPVDIYGESPELTDHISATVQDAANGIIVGQLNWDDGFLLGRKMVFQIQLTIGGRRKTSPVIYVVVE